MPPQAPTIQPHMFTTHSQIHMAASGIAYFPFDGIGISLMQLQNPSGGGPHPRWALNR